MCFINCNKKYSFSLILRAKWQQSIHNESNDKFTSGIQNTTWTVYFCVGHLQQKYERFHGRWQHRWVTNHCWNWCYVNKHIKTVSHDVKHWMIVQIYKQMWNSINKHRRYFQNTQSVYTYSIISIDDIFSKFIKFVRHLSTHHNQETLFQQHAEKLNCTSVRFDT